MRSLRYSFPVLLLALASQIGAEEAILPDGQRIAGELKLIDGRLRLVGKTQSFGLEQIHQVHCRADPLQLHTGGIHRVILRGGQSVTGELLGVDADAVRVRPVWLEQPLILPRWSVAAIAQPRGLATLFHEDFEGELAAWKLTRSPETSDRQHTSGKRSLLLNKAGQSADYVLPAPLEAGRLGVNFRDPGKIAGVRWLLVAEFNGAKGPEVLRVEVGGGASTYRVEGIGESEPVPVRERQPGWHRLVVDFTAGRLVVQVDEMLLWLSHEHGPGGPLVRFSLRCVALSAGATVQGEVWFDDVSLARSVEDLRHPRGDLGQDEIWLLTGDQLFGRVTKADRRTIDLESRAGKRTIPWNSVRAIHLRQEEPAIRSSEGEQVRIWCPLYSGAEPDELCGAVKGLDERRLTLQHPVLGTIAIDRSRIQRVQGLFHGQRIELDQRIHHLGSTLLPGLAAPRPEGLKLSWRFGLTAVPEQARLVLEVSHLKGPADDAATAKALQRGGLRTEVVLNGRAIDYLNRHVERGSPHPRRLSVNLPPDALKAGENTLQLRQTIDSDTGRAEDCIVSAVAVEIPK